VDLHQIEIDLGRQPFVEAELLLAEMAPLLGSTEINKAQGDRLLDLVGKGAGQ
jgi:hypothetical protein